MIDYQYHDGGRTLAGFKGGARDCVARAIAIASGLPYREVYDALAHGNATQRKTRGTRNKGKRTASEGIHTNRKWFKDYMQSIGFEWHACMTIGSGCKVHVHKDELPAKGALVLSLSKHFAAYVDGVLLDTYDCSREGTRCVYGYWIKKST